MILQDKRFFYMLLKTCITTLSGQNARLLKTSDQRTFEQKYWTIYISEKIKSECRDKKWYKRSWVAEYLINNATCAVKYELPTFEILR